MERTPEQEAANEALAKLVRQCMAGDSQAWQQLVVSQHRRIYAICYRFTGSGTDAEDLTQEVFLKLYKNLASFDTQKGSFQTWITTLARNLLVDHFRRTRLDRASDSLDATFDGEDDGPTMADRLADPRPSQEHHVAGLELKVQRPECPQTALPGAPRSCYSSRSRGYGLQRDIPGSPHSRRNRKKPHQSRPRGTCKAAATYRKLGGHNDRKRGGLEWQTSTNSAASKPRQGSDPQHCAQCEAMLSDALDGTLSAADQATFDLHMVGCPSCAAMLADAQRGAAWMEMLKSPRPEPPTALLERILAETSGKTAALASPPIILGATTASGLPTPSSANPL